MEVGGFGKVVNGFGWGVSGLVNYFVSWGNLNGLGRSYGGGG